MHVFLWILQAILAALFAMSGLVKVLQPKGKLVVKFPWMQDFSQATVRFIGVMESSVEYLVGSGRWRFGASGATRGIPVPSHRHPHA
ncbi:DoxX family protein [Nonomuraea basaltis]|uniref:DoxX family protein n=1 Tax=Nonomuraea basaltis TaxID=2495887 RepID=UPI00110C5550|nr:DoxX family protein [Nonomuraea basaltis]TMR91122.1 hypothetical protein EJK15_51715 [Nonomuraea basaltis]